MKQGFSILTAIRLKINLTLYTMSNLTDLAWAALQSNKTEFTVGTHTFNGCTIKVTKRQEPYRYTTGTGRRSTMSARYWGKIIYPDGLENIFEEVKGGEVARDTGFRLREEKALFLEQGSKYLLPYMRKDI